MPYSTSMKRYVGERKEHIISPGTTNYSYIKYKTKSLALENNTVLLIYHGYYKNDTNVICNELKKSTQCSLWINGKYGGYIT